nr:uncharacterized protein LOC108063145 [Drosophila takahashii]
MFRFYKLYSLYMNNMTSGLTRPREWCLCEKLPRAVLHIPVNRHLLCEVCGLARRPQAGLASSSDEDADVQRNLPEQRHAEEPKKGQVSRVKVAIRAKKPKDKRCCRTSCVKCGGLARAEAGQEGTGTGGPEEVKSKVYAGRHGLYSKPRGMPRRQQEPTAPPPSSPSPPSSPRAAPPPPTPPPPPPLSGSPPSLVAMAHDVFSRTNHLSQNYSHLFVSNFIPLQSPITDTFGGAISKRNPPPRSHRSRPLPPLSKILTNNQKELDNREKGGGLGRTKSRDSLDIANELASQFCPFERYEGPSEDALVENSARQLLHRPKSLFIEPRQDLPNNRIESLSRSNEGNENLSGIFFMTKSVRENLIKTINQIGFDCSTSSNKSSSTNLNYHSPIHQQTVQETLAEKYERLQAERSSIMTSIMDQLFSLQAESSEEDKVEKTPEMDELDLTINNLSPEDPETGSLLSDVSTEQTVISSNKTKPYQDYTKLFSKTLSNSSWEREFIKVEDSSPNTTEKESQSISLKCGRCGNVKQNSEQDLKKNIGASRIPRNEKNIMEGKTGPVINVRPRNNTSKKQEEYLKKKDIRPKDANLIRTRIPVNSFGVCRYKEPSTNWGVVKTFEIISHMCREIPKLQVATFARDLMNTGKVIFSYIKESLVTDQPTMSLYEFRLPDINPNELQSYRNQDVFESQSEHVKWDTKDNDLDSSRKEQNEKRESEFETKTRKNNSLDFNIMPKEQKDIPQDRSNQEKPLKSYSSSKLSYDIRRQIDKSMQLKLKKMMSKPIKLLNSAEAGSVVKFLEPFTNRLGVSEENNQNASQISLKQNSEMERNRIHKDSEEYGVLSHASETLKEFHLSQKPLRLITNMSSSSDYESKCLHMGCRSENDSDAASEPIMTYRTTEYEGLPPLNWQVISMGSARLKESIEDLSESEEEYVCPVYKCGNLLKSKTFASHFEQFHRHKTATNALPQEYCHRIVEGLPKQFFFDGDLLTKGNSFVSLLLYSSLKKESSFPLREYPLALLAAPQKVNNKHPTGIFFWLVGYPLGAKLVAKLTVYDPLEQVGRSRIIKPRDLSREQDPRRFHSNCRDHLLITVPYKKQRRFQISVVIDEKSE